MNGAFFISAVAIVFFGLLLGSFLNVVIYRLPQTSAAGLRPSRYGLSFLALPMSFCPHCKTPIRPWHNIPLISYFLLRGNSGCCQKKIHWQYPFIEACGGVIVAAAVLRFHEPLDIILAIAFMAILLVAAAIDWQRFYLLDILTLPLLWLGLLVNLDSRFALLSDAVIGAACGYIFLYLLDALFSLLANRPAMGMGDFKLFAALGAWIGWQLLPMTLFIASLIGIVLAAAYRITRGRGRGRRIPFGPGLAAAGALMLLLGDQIMLLYWDFISK